MTKPQLTGLPWLWLSAVLVVLDQFTKWLASGGLAHVGQSISVLPWLNWTLQHNYGAAFSFLNIPGGAQRWLFSAIAAAVGIGLTVWLRRLDRADWRTALPLALIVSGAFGNLIDRLRFGYVVDFVDVYYGDWHFPAFNVADAAISVGAVALLAFGFSTQTKSKS